MNTIIITGFYRVNNIIQFYKVLIGNRQRGWFNKYCGRINSTLWQGTIPVNSKLSVILGKNTCDILVIIYSTRQKKVYVPHRNYAVPSIKYGGVITLKRTVL